MNQTTPSGSRTGWSAVCLSFMPVGTLVHRIADDPDFPVQLYTELIQYGLLDVPDQVFIVTGCTVIDIDHENGMFRRDFNTADAVSLKSGILDQFSGKIARRTLEDTAA